MVKRFKKLKQILIPGKSDLTPNEIRKIKLKLKNILTGNTSNNDENNYAKYIKEVFNSKIIYMLILYLNKNRDILREKKYDIEPNFINKFIHLIKDLNLNEIELVYLTLLLDKMGWDIKSVDYWNYFHCLGVFTKQFSISEEFVDQYLQGKNEEFKMNYIQVVNQENIDEYNKFTTKEINQRYKELTKPINSFCRKNFINYNSIVDKIFNSTQTYQSKNKKNIKNNNINNNINIINNNILNNNINEENEERKEKSSFLSMNYPNHNSFFDVVGNNRNDIIEFYKNKNISFIAEKRNFNNNY